MRVKFLDDGFCLRFLRCLVPDCDITVRNQFNATRQSNLQILAQIESEKRGLQEADEELARRTQEIAETFRDIKGELFKNRLRGAQESRDWSHKRHEEKLAHLHTLQQTMPPTPECIEFRVRREFETSGVDVRLEISAQAIFRDPPSLDVGSWSWDYWHGWRSSADWRAQFSVELKPAVGDNYPTVLRQMKANGSNVLLVGQYIGTGATREQFFKTFATANIKVVFADEIEARKMSAE